MKLFLISLTISLCIEFNSCSHIGLVQNQPANDENVVLREIITNYLKAYFSDDLFVSLIILPCEKEPIQDFFYSLFHNQVSTEFSYNILDKLDNAMRENLKPLNLIYVDDSKQLQ